MIPPPRETTELVGHDAAENRLLEAWKSGRMPHAWLFTGPRGIGKATLAFRLARFALHNSTSFTGEESGPSLFGETGIRPVTTGLAVVPTLPVARLVANGGQPDLLVIERSINPKTKTLRRDILAEDVASLSAFLRLTPAGSGWRVVIVDSVDDMNRNAANAMLKLLEEPPKRALLILVSHAPGRLLPTILSRCRKLHLSPLRDQDVRALLNMFEPNMTQGLASMATQLAEGSIGRALEIASNEGTTVLRDAVRMLDGAPPVDRKRLHEACDIWVRRGKGEDGDPLPKRMGLLLWWLGQGVRRLAAGQPATTETILGEAKVFNALVGRFGLAGCCERLERAEHTLQRGTALNLDRKQMVMLMMRELTG
jgi:DNA polymerase-3 subunit delta'